MSNEHVGPLPCVPPHSKTSRSGSLLRPRVVHFFIPVAFASGALRPGSCETQHLPTHETKSSPNTVGPDCPKPREVLISTHSPSRKQHVRPFLRPTTKNAPLQNKMALKRT